MKRKDKFTVKLKEWQSLPKNLIKVGDTFQINKIPNNHKKKDKTNTNKINKTKNDKFKSQKPRSTEPYR